MKPTRASLCGIVIALSGLLLLSADAYSDAPAETQPSTQPSAKAPDSPFTANVKVKFTDEFILVDSDGIPNHKTAQYPNKDNPNRILKQDYHFKIPLHPKIADKPTPTRGGPIGVCVNGIPFYNQYNAQRQDAVSGAHAEVFDSCCGHPDQDGRYHYHKYPVCVNTPFKDEANKASALIGFAFDGFKLYGPNCSDGKAPTDLDDCNGHTTTERGYHYHTTTTPPYMIGAYKGVVETSNFVRPKGGPGGMMGRPPGQGRPPGPPPGGPGGPDGRGRPPGPPPPPPEG
jgi:hypothetical protein